MSSPSSQGFCPPQWLQELSLMIDLARQKSISRFHYTKGDFTLHIDCSPSHESYGMPHNPYGHFYSVNSFGPTPGFKSFPHYNHFSNGPMQNFGQNSHNALHSGFFGQPMYSHEDTPSFLSHYSPMAQCHPLPSSQKNPYESHQHHSPSTPNEEPPKDIHIPEPTHYHAPKGKPVTSPLVGTVYLAPREGSDPFVKIGDTVKEGQVLFIVEAMKIMNPIKAPFGGKILSIDAQNACPVEFQQILAHIDVE